MWRDGRFRWTFIHGKPWSIPASGLVQFTAVGGWKLSTQRVWGSETSEDFGARMQKAVPTAEDVPDKYIEGYAAWQAEQHAAAAPAASPMEVEPTTKHDERPVAQRREQRAAAS